MCELDGLANHYTADGIEARCPQMDKRAVGGQKIQRLAIG